MNKLAVVVIIVVVAVIWTILMLGIGYFVGCGMPDNSVAQYVKSPNGSYVAIVRNHWSIDPPNQSLWIRENNTGNQRKLEHLRADFDFIEGIHWSPNSDLVVFDTRCFLLGLRPSDDKIMKVEKEWTEISGSKEARPIASITFLGSGQFGYRYEGIDKTLTVSMDSK